MMIDFYLHYVQRFITYFPENTIRLRFKDQSEIKGAEDKIRVYGPNKHEQINTLFGKLQSLKFTTGGM
jgi:hypothetical protein